jgi:hypothetical protein
MQDLMELGLWTPEMKYQIFANNGSIQNIAEIPSELKGLYKVSNNVVCGCHCALSNVNL